MTGSSGKDVCTYIIICHLILLGMRNVSDKIIEKIKKTPFLFGNFFSKNRSVY
jgi:hypothetical protein